MHSIIVRPTKGKLRIRTPYDPHNPTRALLKAAGCHQVTWDASRRLWLVGRGHMAAVGEALSRLGPVDVYMDGHATQKCDTRCTAALGDECVCSCAGANHGGRFTDMVQVGDTTLISSTTTRAHYRIESRQMEAAS